MGAKKRFENPHIARKKEMLALIRELDNARMARGKLKYLPLDKPILAGYTRSFIVREDVLRTSVGTQIKQLVEATNTTWRAKDEAGPYRPTKYLAWHVEIEEPEQTLAPIKDDDFKKSGLPEEFKAKWFTPITTIKT